MTCGLCHRDSAQHTLSSSGPTRCQYRTHRADCPGSFSTKCSEHVVDGQAAPPEAPDLTAKQEALSDSGKDEAIKKLEEELKKLKFNTEQKHNPTNTTPRATPAATPSGTPGLGLDQLWGQHPQPPQDTSLESIERLVRDYVATNQQHIQSQNPAPGSYTGPNMSEIRCDPQVQTQADLIMNQIKSTCPIFGQNLPTQNVSLPGINPLGQNAPQAPVATPSVQQPQAVVYPGQQQLLQDLQRQLAQLQGQQSVPPQGQQAQGQPGLQLNSLSGIAAPPPLQSQTQPQMLLQNLNHQSPNLLSAIAQLAPSVANPLLQALLQPAAPAQQAWGPMANQQLPQGSGLYSQHVPGMYPQQNGATGLYSQNGAGAMFGQQNAAGLYAQQLLQSLHGLPQSLPVNPLGQGLLGGAHNLQQVQAAQIPQKLAPSNPLQQQGMSSMTGISYYRPTEFVKYCQVDYSKKAKPENCNLVLYVWGYVAQILASKNGLISSMSEQEQIGRL